MNPIEGSAPDPVNVPDGCSYHPRCPLADSTCQADDPGFHEVTDTHDAKCFHWEDAADAIEYSIPGGDSP
jgi:oligopeptide/dipeptide ABC transporter ATP-binding protein